MEEKQMLYINVMICDSDSNRIIDLENKLEEIGELEHIKINIETRHELELQTIRSDIRLFFVRLIRWVEAAVVSLITKRN